MRDAYTDRMIDLHYGLLDQDDAEACRRHAASCPDCAARLDSLQLLGAALRAERAFPREQEVNWDAFARRTVRRALSEPEPAGWMAGLRALFFAPAWPAGRQWALAAAGLVAAAGLSITTYLMLPTLSGPAPQQAQAAAEIGMSEDNLDNLTINLARQNTTRYLNETRAVLVTLLDVNIDCGRDKQDVSVEKAKAMELLRRQRLIAAELQRMPLARAEEVCSDLQRLLLEISSLADCTRADEIRTLRDIVEKKQILVRMELLSQQLARHGGTSA